MRMLQREVNKEIVTAEDDDEAEDEKPRPAKIPDTFPTEALASELSRKTVRSNMSAVLDG